MQIQLDIDVQQIQDDLISHCNQLYRTNVCRFIGNLIIQQFEEQLKDFEQEAHVLRYKVEFKHPDYYTEKTTYSLESIVNEPMFGKPMFSVGYIAVTIVTDKDVPNIHFLPPHNLQWLWEPGIKYVSLKTIQKSILRMNDLGLPTAILVPAVNTLKAHCECPKELLFPHIPRVWDWTLRFICKVCGKTYFCDCFREVFEQHYTKALSLKHRFASNGWPHKFIRLYESSVFRENLCHLCSNTPSELHYCPPNTGSKIKMRYGPYITRISIEKGIDEDEAEDEVRQLLGINPKGKAWTSELELSHMTQLAFPEEEVVYQASPEWLGRQRIDVYLPQLRIALEYQGHQHYTPIAFFGGEEAFNRTQERDKLKGKKCSENNIDLIYFRYDEQISVDTVRSKVAKVLEARKS